ncbi:MAG: hypothetical protein IPG04_32785 [Polyangiaceae bacterium]|nr:hypothetical protein [Polyangiaceae bacterium]
MSSRGRTFNPSVSQAYRARSSGVGGRGSTGLGAAIGRAAGAEVAAGSREVACAGANATGPAPAPVSVDEASATFAVPGVGSGAAHPLARVTTRTALHHPALIDRIMPWTSGLALGL